ncbi:MAG: DNA methyltransferase, partial [Candidatus Desantisbacteria bacterium]
MLFSTNKLYAEKVFAIKEGDRLFLLNIDTDTLYGKFIATSNGGKDLEKSAWNGKYPYQVRVEKNEVKTLKNAKRIFAKLNIDWKYPVDIDRTDILIKVLENPEFELDNIKLPTKYSTNIDEKPKIESTTLWDYPTQSYGKTTKGNNKYPGVTPAFIIYNMIKRYTEPGDLIIDPMAG